MSARAGLLKAWDLEAGTSGDAYSLRHGHQLQRGIVYLTARANQTKGRGLTLNRGDADGKARAFALTRDYHGFGLETQLIGFECRLTVDDPLARIGHVEAYRFSYAC